VIKTGATKSASPKQKQIKNTYISHVKRLIHQKKRYPRLAKRMGHEGTVKIAFTIQANGSIVEARVLSGSGHQRLDKAALKILKSIGRFPPIPKEVGDSTLSITLPIRYKLIT
jgi:protein TonB